MVASLTWVGFKELLIEMFMPEYKEQSEGMNLVQKRHTKFLKAYVGDFNAQMNVTPNMDEIPKKCIVLSGVAQGLFKFPKFFEDVARII